MIPFPHGSTWIRRSVPAPFLLGALLTAPPLEAQAVSESLVSLTEQNAALYLEPLTRGLGFALSEGVFDGAPPLGRFRFDVGIRGVGALPPTSAETYEPLLPEEVSFEHPSFGETVFAHPFRIAGGRTRTPTVAGDGPGVVLEPDGEFRTALEEAGIHPSQLDVVLPQGFSLPVVPVPLLYASLGLGYATDVSLRFLPRLRVDDEIGELRSNGVAIRHALTEWFEAPVDLSVGLGFQKVRVGSYLESSSRQFGLLVGRNAGPLTVFGSGVVRSASVDVSYVVENPESNPGLPPDGQRFSVSETIGTGTAIGFGLRLQLLLLNLTARYTFDDYSLISLQAGLGVP